MPTFTVREIDGVVQLSVIAVGSFPSPELQSRLTVPVEAVVLVYTDDITAEGGTDLLMHLILILLTKHIHRIFLYYAMEFGTGWYVLANFFCISYMHTHPHCIHTSNNHPHTHTQIQLLLIIRAPYKPLHS